MVHPTSKQLGSDTLATLFYYMGARGVDSVQRGAQRLLQILSPEILPTSCVLVAYGGGKDSSYTVAFVRAIQLELLRHYKQTFRLRIATNRHAGMPPAVLENIDRTYRALDMYDDPHIEMLLIDGNDVTPFDVACPLPQHIVERNRLDMLMTGHRCQGDARPTFCNACNLSMANSFGVALAYGQPVDLVITGDSKYEQRAYAAWIYRVAEQFGIPNQRSRRGFIRLLETLDGIAYHYFSYIYGHEAQESIQARRVTANHQHHNPIFFSIYQDTNYQAGDHWELLTTLLGFQFDEIAFSFTESDCANPALMAHLRGLKVEHVYGRSYAEGIDEYVAFAVDLMRKKAFPPHLIEHMQQRYASAAAIKVMRAKLNQYAHTTYHLSEAQLVCMLFSPFTNQGQNLTCYLTCQQPALVPATGDIHRLLAVHESNNDPSAYTLIEQLQAISGLDIAQLRTIYHAPLVTNSGAHGTPTSPLSVILAGDPHKAVIETRHHADGPKIAEVISGR